MRNLWKFSVLSLFFCWLPEAFADQASQDINIFRSKAVEAQFMGKSEQALNYYWQALKIAEQSYGANSPYLSEIYYEMGTTCVASSNFNKAEEFLAQAIKLNPNSSAAHLSLASLLRVKGRANEAARHAAFVVSKHNDDLVAREELAFAYGRNDDNLRAMIEFSNLEQLVQQEREAYEGKEQGGFKLPGLNLFQKVKLNESPQVSVLSKPLKSEPPKAKPEDSKKKAADEAAKKKAAEAAKKKAADDAVKKKAADEAAKKKAAEAAKKKAADDAAKKKAADEAARKKAADETAKKKSEEAKKKQAKPAAKSQEAVAGSEETPATGLPANLHSKAVLLTPVPSKKPAQAESTSTISVEKPKTKPESKPPVKKNTPKEESSAEPQQIKPKPGKHAPGLVPPPPPVMTYPQMQPMTPMAAPAPPAPKPKPPAPKKEEKAKESPKEDKGGDDADFLLDWGGANSKKK